MAHPNLRLIEALRTAAQQLREGAPYSWGHHGRCNCGHLSQALTTFNDAEIQRFAHTGAGEWTEMAYDYCGLTGAPVDMLVAQLMEAGLTPTDIHHLEYLSDKTVLQHLPGGFRWLKKNKREDAILYFEAMAQFLEEQLLDDAVRTAVADVFEVAETV